MGPVVLGNQDDSDARRKSVGVSVFPATFLGTASRVGEAGLERERRLRFSGEDQCAERNEANIMLTNEEKSLLACLRERIVAAVDDLARMLLPGAPGALERAIWNLGWLGYVDVAAGPRGEARILQITQKGLAEGGGWLPSHADLAVCSSPGDFPTYIPARPFLTVSPRRPAAIETPFALPSPARAVLAAPIPVA